MVGDVLGVVLPGLPAVPGVVPVAGVVPGGQVALALSATSGSTLDVAMAWLCKLPGAVLPTHGLISGTEPGVVAGPGVFVGVFPGTVPGAAVAPGTPGVPICPVLVPIVPGWVPLGELEVPAVPVPLVVWARAREASASVKVAISKDFCMCFFSP